MNGKEASSSDAQQPLKRPRTEEEINNQAEEEEGLVALVKKRRSDVKQLVTRISTLEAELSAARKKLGAAESLLHAMQGTPVKSGERIKKELPYCDIRHQNGHGEGKSSGPNVGLIGNSLKGNVEACTPSGSKPGSFPGPLYVRSSDKPSSARPHSSSSARDPTDVSGSPMQSRMHNSGGGRIPSEADKRDKKAHDRTSGGETSQKVARPSSTPPRQKEHVDLIMTIKSKSKPQPVSTFNPAFYPSQHKRKMRSLALNPSSDNQCVTSALDGVINFWKIHAKGIDVNFQYSVDCFSPGERHWPEDLAWHPDGRSLFAIYTAENEDSQVSIIKNDNKQKKAKFLPYKPHIRGILNGIAFMPWSSSLFVTVGTDHMVHLWREHDEEDVWKPKLLHASIHTSAVHGIAGTHHKQLVLSAGADKRVIGFDPVSSRTAFRHELESKAMTVLPNTADFNLFMVQTGQPNKQLHLFDIRSKTELHTFGWQQESSDTQSSLITQSWSPDGYYTASGTADPKIVLFDIRFNSREPAQTIYAHNYLENEVNSIQAWAQASVVIANVQVIQPFVCQSNSTEVESRNHGMLSKCLILGPLNMWTRGLYCI